jgi:toluene monooxygenase system ferredoxin subunit
VAFQKVASLDDLWSGEMTAVSIDGQYILLVNIDDMVRAYADACPHKRTRLSQGSLRGCMLTCATHQWQFDALTGKGVNPATACLEEFPVRIENSDILVDFITACSGDEKPVKWCDR